MTMRGGGGEPYCSEKCYNQAGIGINGAFSKGIRGVCGFCQEPVQYGPSFSVTNCVAFPMKGPTQTLFICRKRKCIEKSKKYISKLKECCMCGKPI